MSLQMMISIEMPSGSQVRGHLYLEYPDFKMLVMAVWPYAARQGAEVRGAKSVSPELPITL
jgi:hypothetical protein